VQGCIHAILDAVEDTGEMDVVHDLAMPLPVLVISEMMGVPAASRTPQARRDRRRLCTLREHPSTGRLCTSTRLSDARIRPA